MLTRERYVSGAGRQLRTWGDYLRRFEARLEQRVAEARARLRYLRELEQERRRLAERLASAREEGEGWPDARGPLEHDLEGFRRRAGAVYDDLKR